MTTHAANDPLDAAQSALGLALPIAKIRGEPMTELPADLYIPPEALSVFLDAFEGPLDLLLYLIRRHSLDILDIPMAELTRQYMEYVEMMRSTQLELAADYLLMAALLIEIKSRMLLPRPRGDEQAEPEDPRAELVRRLLEYERMKKAAYALGELPVAGRDFSIVEVALDRLVERLPGVQIADLSEAWRSILAILNPLAPLIESLRWILIGTGSIRPLWLVTAMIETAVLFLIGALFFQRVERTIIDTV